MSIVRVRQIAAFAAVTAIAASPSLRHAFAQTPTSAAETSTVALSGAIAKPDKLTATALEARFASNISTIRYEAKDKSKHTARVIPLLTLLQSSGILTNPNIKHHELQFIIAVRGHDGYTVDFSLAELLPTFGNRTVWVAFDEDGKPFTGEDGPIGLIAAADVKPARSVHGVVAITVIDGAAAAMAK